MLAMRVMLSTAESIWSWLASISSGLTPPLLAAWTISSLMLTSRLADLVEGAFGGGDDVAGALGVVDRLLDAGHLAAQRLAGDQAGRVVGAAVDPQAAGEPLQRLVQGFLSPVQVGAGHQ